MLRLNLSRKPVWTDLGHGVRLLCGQITTQVMNEMRHAPEIVSLRPDGDDRSDDGAPMPLPRAVTDALALVSAKVLARAVVHDWEGVGDEDGNPIPVTPEGLEALLDMPVMFAAFQERVYFRAFALELEKNG